MELFCYFLGKRLKVSEVGAGGRVVEHLPPPGLGLSASALQEQHTAAVSHLLKEA